MWLLYSVWKIPEWLIDTVCVTSTLFFRRQLFRWGNGIEKCRKGNSALKHSTSQNTKGHIIFAVKQLRHFFSFRRLETLILGNRNIETLKHKWSYSFFFLFTAVAYLYRIQHIGDGQMSDLHNIQTEEQKCNAQQFLPLTELHEKPQVLLLTEHVN